MQARAFLQHRQQQRQPLLVDAARHAPRISIRAAADERLHFHQYRPRSLDATQHRRARLADRSLGEKHLRRVRHFAKTRAGHLEHAQLAGRAEAILERTHDTMGVMPLAFEIEHRVDDVFQGFRAGEAAVFRDVAHEHNGNILSLRGEEQMRRHLAHLADAAGRRLKPSGKNRLYRVHDDERRLQALDLFKNALEAGFGEQVKRRAIDGETLSAQFDLMLGFFAGAVENRPDAARHVRGHLQQQRRLADAGLAAKQHERSRHNAAAQHAIEFLNARRNSRRVGGFDIAVEPGGRAARNEAVPMVCRRGRAFRRRLLFDERVPRAAIGAAPHPFLLLPAALLAREHRLRRPHSAILHRQTKFSPQRSRRARS